MKKGIYFFFQGIALTRFGKFTDSCKDKGYLKKKEKKDKNSSGSEIRLWCEEFLKKKERK